MAWQSNVYFDKKSPIRVISNVYGCMYVKRALNIVSCTYNRYKFEPTGRDYFPFVE